MLLPEEKMIMYCLSQYESILMDQAIRFLYHKPNQTAQKIIRGLRKQHRLSYLHEGSYIGAGPVSKADPKTEEAIWVLLRYIDQIGHMAHRKADYPSQIYFIRDETAYEILVLREGEERLTAHLHPRDDMKYIICNNDAIPCTETFWNPLGEIQSLFHKNDRVGAMLLGIKKLF